MDITYAVLSSQIGFKSSTITRVEYIGFSYYVTRISLGSISSTGPTYLAICQRDIRIATAFLILFSQPNRLLDSDPQYADRLDLLLDIVTK